MRYYAGRFYDIYAGRRVSPGQAIIRALWPPITFAKLDLAGTDRASAGTELEPALAVRAVRAKN